MACQLTHGSTEHTVASLLRERLSGPGSGDGKKRLADALGHTNLSMIDRFISGEAKVPVDKAPVIASVLGLDPPRFLELALNQFSPAGTYSAIFDRLVTENELVFITRIREAANHSDPVFEEESAPDRTTDALPGSA